MKGLAYGVCIKSLLPYEALLVPYTYFFYLQGKKQLTTNQQKYLSDYFWRSNLVNRFGSSTDTTINADLSKMDDIFADKTPVQEVVSLTPFDIIQRGNTSLTSAFSKAMLCLMYTNNPRSFAPGREIFISNNPQSDSAEKQLHHFFPQKSQVALSSPDYKNKVNSIVNIVFMDALTNQQIGNSNPSEYIAAFSQNNGDFNSILHSHFIDINGFGIEADNFDLFLQSRSKKMYEAILARLVICEGDNLLVGVTDDNKNLISTIIEEHVQENDVEYDDVFEIFARGKGVKTDVVKYLKTKGIRLTSSITYAAYQEDKNAYWANPRQEMLNKDWTIILNNHITKTIIVLIVPAGTFVVNKDDGPQGLFIRADYPYRVDLNIRVNTLCDRRSNLDFSSFEQYRLDYSQETAE